MASVELSDAALADLESLDISLARRVVSKAIWFGEHFSELPHERLHGTLRDLYKLRVGDYRVIYSIRGQHVTVEAIRHRSDAYL